MSMCTLYHNGAKKCEQIMNKLLTMLNVLNFFENNTRKVNECVLGDRRHLTHFKKGATIRNKKTMGEFYDDVSRNTAERVLTED